MQEDETLKLEREIKHYMFPYQVHLKLTQIGKYPDDHPMLVDDSGDDGFQYTLDFDLK